MKTSSVYLLIHMREGTPKPKHQMCVIFIRKGETMKWWPIHQTSYRTHARKVCIR